MQQKKNQEHVVSLLTLIIWHAISLDRALLEQFLRVGQSADALLHLRARQWAKRHAFTTLGATRMQRNIRQRVIHSWLRCAWQTQLGSTQRQESKSKVNTSSSDQEHFFCFQSQSLSRSVFRLSEYFWTSTARNSG